MRKVALALLLALVPTLALAANLTAITVTRGVPTGGTGTVSTLDNLIGTAGSPTMSVQTVQGISSMTPFLTTTTLNAETTKVIGTVNQGTSPWVISGAVTGTFWQATQPVSGTFYQTTQPVSLATAPTTPVTGTFWQTTQPVSGTFYQTTQPVSLASAQVASGAVASGAFASGSLASGAGTDGWDATKGAKGDTVCATATGTCSLIALQKFANNTLVGAIPAGTNLIGKVGIDQTTPGTTNGVVLGAETTKVIGTVNQGTSPWVISGAVTGTFWQATQPVSIASLPSGAVTNAGTFAVQAAGPTAAASPAANPPVIIGGTVDGTATGNVDNWKVLSGIGYVNCSNCSSSGVSAVDEASFTWGTTPYVPAGGFYQTTATSNALTTGQAGAWQMTAQRAGFINVRNASGTEMGTASNPFIVGQATAANLNMTEASATAILAGVTGAIPAGAALIGKVGIDQTTPGTTNKVVASVASGAVASGAYASGSIASGAYASGALASGAGSDGWNVTEGAKADTVCATATGTCSIAALQKYANNALGGAIPAATAPYVIIGGVINGANTYNTVAASQTAQALTGGSGGATGDYLSHCTIIPALAASGLVTIYDNSTAIYRFLGGGTTALTTLIPFTIPVGAVSTSGAWKVTTGASVSVVCVGKFH